MFVESRFGDHTRSSHIVLPDFHRDCREKSTETETLFKLYRNGALIQRLILLVKMFYIEEANQFFQSISGNEMFDSSFWTLTEFKCVLFKLMCLTSLHPLYPYGK